MSKSNVSIGKIFKTSSLDDSVVTVAGGCVNDGTATWSSTNGASVPLAVNSKGQLTVVTAGAEVPLGTVTFGFRSGTASGFTGSFSPNILTLSRCKILNIQNDTNQALIVSLDGGASEFCFLPATTGNLSFNFAAGNIVISGNLVCKTTGSATTTGTFRVSAVS